MEEALGLLGARIERFDADADAKPALTVELVGTGVEIGA
jgi:hypothetical protein